MHRLASRDIALVSLFAALIAVCAFVAIPVGSVPFTLQVFAVLLAGLILGPRLAVASVVVYLVLGLVAPVFAGGTGGLGVLAGPTGGYLIAFIPAAAITGLRRESGGFGSMLLLALAGLVPIYALGALWLGLQLHLDDPMAVLTAGVIPFLPFDVVKAFLAAAVARGLLSLPLGLPELRRER